MRREHDSAKLIELGRASLETKGGPEGKDDFQGGLFRKMGLSLD
jgi:hypothetical protein